MKRSRYLIGAAAAVLAVATSGGGAHAQPDDLWVLVDVEVNPAGDPPPEVWDLTTTTSSMTIVAMANDGSGAEAAFDASWTPPPATLVPGDPVVIPVTVSGRNTGNLEVQYFWGLDVILIVDGTWNNAAVGAGASCVQTTVISGEYVCSEPETNTGEMRTTVPSYGESFTLGVSALNCGGACYVRWTYERTSAQTPSAATLSDPSDAVVVAGGDASGSSVAAGSAADGNTTDAAGVSPTASATAASSESGDGSGGVGVETIAITAIVGAGVAAGVVTTRRRPRRGRDGSDEDGDERKPKEVLLELTYPAGMSPYVFQRGWLFGARAIVAPGTPEQRDVSDQVRWSGDAKFDPPVGRLSRPSFLHLVGGVDVPMVRTRAPKRITLQVEVDGVTTETTTTVGVTGVADFARIGDHATCPADAHGCPACPHPTEGPVTSGSPTVLLDGRPAARVGDHGIHAACCGPNTFTIMDGDETVLIDGHAAARVGSHTAHCGGDGTIIWGSPG